MNEADGPRKPTLPLEVARRFDPICDGFEDDWLAGRRPQLEEFLDRVPQSDRSALLREMILLEIDYRRRAGEQPATEEYLARFPTLDRAWIEGVLSATVPTLLRRSRASPEPSGLSGDVPAPPHPTPQWLEPAFAAGVGSGRGGDIQTLLRKRLRLGGLVLSGLYAYFTIATAHKAFRNFDYFREYRYSFSLRWLVFLGIASLTGTLWRKRELSVKQLRALETACLALLLADTCWILLGDLVFAGELAQLYRLARTVEEAEDLLFFYSCTLALGFVLIIIGYATLVPSDWRRCTLVVSIMAFTPLTVSTAAGLATMPDSGTFLLSFVLPLAVFLIVAVVIASYGSHRIQVLRQEASAARKLGQYQLKQPLGSGGMGEVYLAEHLLLKQPCAIKLIRPQCAGDPTTLRRFEREVQATARLKHWNTVQIFDYGHAADGTFYYVMEYLPGLTLEQLVKQYGPLPPGRAIHLLRQLCLALREAHALGLIHRDIKPANIMVCERGGEHDVVKLLDFGLVKAVGLARREETLTQEGAITGTPTYMSPEQAAGKDRLDGRSDIYSLGAVAYFLLTGSPPFPRDGVIEAIVAHLHEAVRPLTDLCPQVPADLQAVVLRCLEKDPARRFADVNGLHQALANCGCADR
jgi:serine/threonine-protein kinase